jgi:hypothetical protein
MLLTPAAKKSFAGIVGMQAKHIALRFNPNPRIAACTVRFRV